MNLHQTVRGVIGAVNPFVIASLQVSIGSTTAADGTRTPTYARPAPVSCQVQALQFSDLTQLDGLNIQGIKRKIYVNGRWDGLVRAGKKGGDLITMKNGDVYLVVLVLEYWPDWCSVAVTLQNRA
jgi:hypothetical protein